MSRTRKGRYPPGADRGGVASAAATLEARFWAKVMKTERCWVWTAGKNHAGYGMIWTGGKPYQQPAHRISLQLAGVEIPEGMFIDHICRNRACVRPAHLRIVTPNQNALENNDNPFVRNHYKTACVHGHPLVAANVFHRAIKGPKGTPMVTRECLACRRKVSPGTRYQPNTHAEAMALAKSKFGRRS